MPSLFLSTNSSSQNYVPFRIDQDLVINNWSIQAKQTDVPTSHVKMIRCFFKLIKNCFTLLSSGGSRILERKAKEGSVS